VEQRPDIKAAEAAMHAASAQIGVATANMLPQLTLQGSYGSEAIKAASLFTSGAEVWSIGAGLTQPIFHGGTLLHERRAAVAIYEQTKAQYRSTVLSAFQNVADTLNALHFDAEALATQLTAEQTAKESFDMAQMQFKDGAISYPQLLDSERTYQQTHIALAQAQAARFADTAALFQALGGGWNQPLSAPPSISTTAEQKK
jgi:NodT family efflux transporter outer membrane factor (OMF) lipoprotein